MKVVKSSEMNRCRTSPVRTLSKLVLRYLWRLGRQSEQVEEVAPLRGIGSLPAFERPEARLVAEACDDYEL